MHAGHHADVVIVDLVDLLEVEELRQLAFLVGKDEVCHRLRDEGRADENVSVDGGLLILRAPCSQLVLALQGHGLPLFLL
jgi:hypothetical protein